MMNALERRIIALRAAGRLDAGSGRTLAGIAQQRVDQDPDRLIIQEGGRSVTRGALFDMACRLGGALRARGLGPGAAIGFQLPNWWESAVINLTAALFGYRLVPLLMIYRRAEFETMFAALDLSAIFVPETYRGFDHPALCASVAAAPAHVLTLRGAPGADTFEALLAHAPAVPEPAPAGDIKQILFTSGSTGRPKGVLHSHAAVTALIETVGEFWQFGPDDRLYVPSPIGHIGGSIYAFEFPWVFGCAAILAERWDAATAVDEMAQHGATFMAGATPFLSGLIAASEQAGTRLPALRRFICGGASVPPELVQRGLARFPNATVSRAYGSTEVPLVCPGIRSRDAAQAHSDTDGEIAADLMILSDDGQPLPEGTPGEIAVRAPQMLAGYLDPQDDADAFIGDGYILMGDLGQRVPGGWLTITGRKKEIIIRKGENLSPLEVENALARHPAVRQSAVVGIPDPERGEMVVVFVLPHPGQAFDFAAMTAHLDGLGLARQKFPERLHVVADLPLNTVGKVQKNLLKVMAAEAERLRR